MNTRTKQVVAFVTTYCALALPPSFAQDASKTASRPNIETLREQAKPGPEHEKLAKHVGDWTATVTMGEGDRARTSRGRMKTHMMMDDRFLWIAYNVSGRAGAFKGAFMIGFDRRNSRYTLVGIDTHGTYSVSSQGTADPKTGKIKLYGSDDDPNMKALGFDKEFVHVLDFQNANEMTIDVHYIDNRSSERREMKAMAFVFARRQ